MYVSYTKRLFRCRPILCIKVFLSKKNKYCQHCSVFKWGVLSIAIEYYVIP